MRWARDSHCLRLWTPEAAATSFRSFSLRRSYCLAMFSPVPRAGKGSQTSADVEARKVVDTVVLPLGRLTA